MGPMHRSYVAAFALSVAACSSTTTVTKAPPAEDPDAGEELGVLAPTNDGGGAACTLPAEVSSGRASCDDCLLAKCCEVINTCFDDAPCEEMNDCVNACGQQFPDRGSTEAADCVRTCANKDTTAQKKLLDQMECRSSRCSAPCKA